MYLYLDIAKEVVSSFLIRETEVGPSLVYFISNTLAGSKTRYQKIEKASLVVVVAPQKIIRCFLAHFIVVRTGFPLRHMLYRPYLAGRLTKWTIKLSKFEIYFKARKAFKA